MKQYEITRERRKVKQREKATIKLSLVASSATRSHVGHHRKINEDAAFSDIGKGLWVVADGMGGYAAGDVASQTVVQCLADASQKSLLNDELENCVQHLKNAVLQANQRLLLDTTLPRGCQTLGSTVAILFYHAVENYCVCLWAGDTRLYLFRDNNLFQITRDHSVVQEMVDNGLLDEVHRDTHPQSHVITRAVGVHDPLELDTLVFQPLAGDTYVLCSDGLYNEVRLAEQVMASGINSGMDGVLKSGQLADALIDAVLRTEARDNVTLTVISLE